MLTNSTRGRRSADQTPDERANRGQVILIGAIALAFIILGVVVVFNGVLYTETLSSADTGQSASSAETTELEVRQGVGCLLNATESPEDDLDEFVSVYRNATAESSSVVVDLVYDSTDIDENSATVTLVYDSNDLGYERELTIDASDCPRNP